MLIHFAFGALGKQDKAEEQTEKVIECILQKKRLLVSKCKEFIPKFPEKGAKRIPREMFKVTDDGMAATFYPKEDPEWFRKLPDDTTIHYLPFDVPMICFIKISFNQLRASTHSREYGKFGIVLTDSFLTARGIKPVYYYTEETLWNDTLIKKWNYSSKSISAKEKSELEKEIVSYRKPASLFPSFEESVITKLTRTTKGMEVEYLTYDRYQEGYNFRKENEYRIAFDEGVDYLYFDEGDIFMVITPDSKAMDRVESFLKHNWSQQPQVKLFPS